MQTFMPYPNLKDTVECLDYRRLGKQRVECFQILKTLLVGGQKGWNNHPAVKMWKGSEGFLGIYMDSCISEWIARGYKNNMAFSKDLVWIPRTKKIPFWFGDDSFHSSHRSALLFKDREYYSQFGWQENPELNYVWPV